MMSNPIRQLKHLSVAASTTPSYAAATVRTRVTARGRAARVTPQPTKERIPMSSDKLFAVIAELHLEREALLRAEIILTRLQSLQSLQSLQAARASSRKVAGVTALRQAPPASRRLQ